MASMVSILIPTSLYIFSFRGEVVYEKSNKLRTLYDAIVFYNL